jgi:malonate decarboxylase beta subunit
VSTELIAKREADEQRKAVSWYEASARERVRLLLDVHSFQEFIGPEKREISPHLHVFNLPEQFDDGMIVGRGLLERQKVFVAAQEGRFMGGALGEVHGAKLTGLLRAVRDSPLIPLVILFDTGGVRLQEANAGELAIAEIMRALIEARTAGAKVVGLIGGRAGCYGGGGLIAGCCSVLAVSEQGRISVSGRLIGGADMFVDDTIESFRVAAIHLIRCSSGFDTDALESEQVRLAQRLQQFGSCTDAIEIWRAAGIDNAEAVPGMATDDFIALADNIRRPRYDSR